MSRLAADQKGRALRALFLFHKPNQLKTSSPPSGRQGGGFVNASARVHEGLADSATTGYYGSQGQGMDHPNLL